MVITVKFDCKLVLLTAIYMSIGIAALLLAFPWMAVWIPSNSSELAVWVQAVGAVLAILFAIYISSRDRKHSRQLQVDAEKTIRRNERETAGALITRFCGTLQASLKEHYKGVEGYLWDYQRTRVLLGSELELIKNIPLNALLPDERQLLFSIHIVALQFYEALINTEKHTQRNAEDRLISDENSRLLISMIVESELSVIDIKNADLQRIWTENNRKYYS